MKKPIAKPPVIICPGFHEASLTEQFVQSVFPSSVLPTGELPPRELLLQHLRPLVVAAFCADPLAVFDWMTQTLGSPEENPQPVVAIGFSGGVVGIAGALLLWQQQGGQVKKLIAIDGWGMPIVGLPACRLSHDYFTHWSSLPLGAGKVNFYADPPVDHLQMWRDPNRVSGQAASSWQRQNDLPVTASEFIRQMLSQPDI